ncbi:hypothetical protein DL546_005669 [Coniochaeta pulveracea]|uniref:Uncharacterized protein n=1 Tax=Coniochaeta pulveracea TaxID=177199 RepID=A0A420Y406_9PEZI|nr:hypothetical protein DL546_005669 [Coniochaeta pulveracea]
MKTVICLVSFIACLVSAAPTDGPYRFGDACGRGTQVAICTSESFCAKVEGFYNSRDCGDSFLGCCYDIPALRPDSE